MEKKRGVPTRPYVAREIADGRKSLPQQVISALKGGVIGVGIVPPEANAPHLVKWLVSVKSLLPVLKVVFHLRVLRKLGKCPCENGVTAFPFPNNIVGTPDAPPDALV